MEKELEKSEELSVYSVSPDKEQLEELGFVFESDPKKPGALIVTLPEGWVKKENNIIDAANNVRGEYNKEESKITLKTYFMPMVCTEKNNVVHIFFGNESEILFDAGEIDCNWYYDLVSSNLLSRYTAEQYGERFSASKEEKGEKVRIVSASIIEEEVAEKKAACVSYANEMYPGWDRVTSYWPDKYDRVNRKN